MFRLSLSIVCCCVCVVIHGEIRVLVNRVSLRSVEPPSAARAALPASRVRHVSHVSRVLNVDYHFVADDTVDACCARFWTNCSLTMDYHFSEGVGGNGSIAEEAAGAVAGLAGVAGDSDTTGAVCVRRALGPAQHGARLRCRCSSEYHTTALNLTFLLRNSTDDIMVVKVNGTRLLYKHTSTVNSAVYEVLYAYKRNEILSFESVTRLAHVHLKRYSRKLTNLRTTDAMITVIPNDAGELQYTVLNHTTTLWTVFVKFLPVYVRDDAPLNINLSSSVLELYRWSGDRLIYYYYDEDESLTLNCSTSIGLVATNNYSLVFGDIVERHSDSIFYQTQLGSGHNNTRLNCSLRDEHAATTLRHISVLLRLRNDGNSSDTKLAVMIGAAVLSTCVLVALVAFCCICRRNAPRNRLETLELEDCSKLQRRPLPCAPCDADRDSCYDSGGNVYCALPPSRPAEPNVPAPAVPARKPRQEHNIYQNKTEIVFKYK